MKKEYMKPAMCVVELQHKTQLLQASQTNIVQTSGLDTSNKLSPLIRRIAVSEHPATLLRFFRENIRQIGIN